MIDRRSQLLWFGFLVSDLFLTALAWVIAYVLRFESGWLARGHDPLPFSLCARQLPMIFVLAGVAYRVVGMYDIGRLRRFREEMIAVMRGTALMSLLVMSSLFFLHDPYESRATILLFSALTMASVLLTRRFGWGAVRMLRSRGYNRAFALVVGSGRGARRLDGILERVNWLGIKNIGFVDDHPSALSADLDVVGIFADLPDLIRKYNVSHVFITLPFHRYDDIRRVFAILSQTMVEVRLVPDIPSLAGLTLTTANLDGLPLIGLRESPHFGLNIVVKRVMDTILSAIALVLIAPLLGRHRGPRQDDQSRPRSSSARSAAASTAARSSCSSSAVCASTPRRSPVLSGPRRTTTARPGSARCCARRASTNCHSSTTCLRGDMSLVGPRPERPEFVAQFKKTIPSYMARHCVKAGITGWAQVHGWRGNTSLRKRIEYDLYYITHWTPWLDFRILWMTVFNGLIHKNAY